MQDFLTNVNDCLQYYRVFLLCLKFFGERHKYKSLVWDNYDIIILNDRVPVQHWELNAISILDFSRETRNIFMWKLLIFQCWN